MNVETPKLRKKTGTYWKSRNETQPLKSNVEHNHALNQEGGTGAKV